MAEFLKVSENRDIELTALIADEVWHEHYDGLIGKTQVDYMVEKLQSASALKEQLANGYEYYLIMDGDEPAGYTGIHQEEGGSLFLSKLYLKKANRGKGLSSEVFAFLEKLCRERDLNRIWLTVNKHNNGSIAVYKHKGFKTFDARETDIGGGYVMDDYFMERFI